MDTLAKAAAAVVCAAFAMSVVPARSRAARWLTVFLLLIAVNQGAEALRSLTAEPYARLALFRTASVVAALDPAAFTMFALAVTQTRSKGAWMEVASCTPAMALALVAGWTLTEEPVQTGPEQLFSLVLGTYTFIAYAAVLLLVGRVMRRRPYSREGGALVAAIAIIAITAGARPGDYFHGLMALPVVSWLEFARFVSSIFLPSILLAALIGWTYRGAEAVALRRLAVVLVVALALLVLTKLADIFITLAHQGIDLHAPWQDDLGRASASIRWLLFGALASVAIGSGPVLDMSLGTRRRAARILIGAGVLVVAVCGYVLALAIFPSLPRTLGVAELAIAMIAVMFSQSFRSALDVVAHRVYGVPPANDRSRAIELYQAAAEQAAAKGAYSARDPLLQKLRSDLGLDALTASTLERIAEERTGSAIEVGTVVGGRYHVTEPLGAGGSARVYRSVDMLLDREVVLKEFYAGRGGEEAVLREARIAGSIDHPNILRLLDVVRRGNSYLLALEHAPGGSLQLRLEREEPMTPEERLTILSELLSALTAVHGRGIIHGDVKPGNILFGSNGQVLLTDFGLARIAEGETMHLAGGLRGTPGYLAPEVFAGARPSTRSDVYGVGMVARQLFRGSSIAPVEAVVEVACRTDPEARWADATAMADALARAIESAKH